MENLLPLLGGILLLILGSDLAVRGSLALARHWGWPDWVAGMVLLALGTSLPELFVCAQSATTHPELAIGTIMGSNAFNVGIVLSLMLVLKGRQSLEARGLRRTTGLPLVLATVLSFFAFTIEIIPTWVGPVFLLGYIAMMVATLRSGRHDPTEDAPLVSADWPAWTDSLMALGGFALLAYGSDWFLDGALGLANSWGWNAGFAGYLIAAVGTSSPELATSIQALRAKKAGAVFGNILGSNAFNLLLAGGAVGFLAGPIAGAVDLVSAQEALASLRPQLWVNAAATVALIIPALFMKRRATWPLASKMSGIAGLALYAFGAWWVYQS